MRAYNRMLSIGKLCLQSEPLLDRHSGAKRGLNTVASAQTRDLVLDVIRQLFPVPRLVGAGIALRLGRPIGQQRAPSSARSPSTGASLRCRRSNTRLFHAGHIPLSSLLSSVVGGVGFAGLIRTATSASALRSRRLRSGLVSRSRRNSTTRTSAGRTRLRAGRVFRQHWTGRPMACRPSWSRMLSGLRAS
jgi:hypothetical protein